MNDLLDRIDADPLATLRPQSARENERALAFAIELTEGSPALDAVRGRGILSSMIAEQRAQMEQRAEATQRPSTGFTRPLNRTGIAPARSSRPGNGSNGSNRSNGSNSYGYGSPTSAEGSFALPAQPRSGRSGDAGSRISASSAQQENWSSQPSQPNRPSQSNQQGQSGHRVVGMSRGEARAKAMSPAQAAMLGSSATGSPGQRFRTVDAPAYGASPSRSTQARTTEPPGYLSSYATNGSSALADPLFVAQSAIRENPSRSTVARPTLSVLRGGKTVGSTRKKVLGLLAIVALVTIAFAAVFMHASLARTQLGIDKLNIDIAQAERMNQRLRVQVATLEAPDRIVSVAQELGLEPPRTVRFLPTAKPLALAATRIVR